MQKINSASSLHEAILQLEMKQAAEQKLLKDQFQVVYESLKPVSLIRSVFKQVTESIDLKKNLVNTSVGLTAGYLSKMLFQGVTRNPIKKLLGTAIMFGITNLVVKNPEVIGKAGHGLFNIYQKIAARRKTANK
jgi:hypothetical protein